mmetsp:Transcript_72137/g.192421  ORF Transcript_72137/g.192421 Transcript_72137/m.192421 type:complete len:290 (-) Transcript_72137:40-909(-)
MVLEGFFFGHLCQCVPVPAFVPATPLRRRLAATTWQTFEVHFSLRGYGNEADLQSRVDGVTDSAFVARVQSYFDNSGVMLEVDTPQRLTSADNEAETQWDIWWLAAGLGALALASVAALAWVFAVRAREAAREKKLALRRLDEERQQQAVAQAVAQKIVDHEKDMEMRLGAAEHGHEMEGLASDLAYRRASSIARLADALAPSGSERSDAASGCDDWDVHGVSTYDDYHQERDVDEIDVCWDHDDDDRSASDEEFSLTSSQLAQLQSRGDYAASYSRSFSDDAGWEEPT